MTEMQSYTCNKKRCHFVQEGDHISTRPTFLFKQKKEKKIEGNVSPSKEKKRGEIIFLDFLHSPRMEGPHVFQPQGGHTSSSLFFGICSNLTHLLEREEIREGANLSLAHLITSGQRSQGKKYIEGIFFIFLGLSPTCK